MDGARRKLDSEATSARRIARPNEPERAGFSAEFVGHQEVSSQKGFGLLRTGRICGSRNLIS